MVGQMPTIRMGPQGGAEQGGAKNLTKGGGGA